MHFLFRCTSHKFSLFVQNYERNQVLMDKLDIAMEEARKLNDSASVVLSLSDLLEGISLSTSDDQECHA